MELDEEIKMKQRHIANRMNLLKNLVTASHNSEVKTMIESFL